MLIYLRADSFLNREENYTTKMKLLKAIITVILILIGLFFLVGLLKPAVNYGHTIEVNKPLKEAWAVSQDDSKYNQWLKGFKSIELLSGEKNAVGSTYKVVVSPGDGNPDFEMIETLKSIKEFEEVDLHFDSEMMDFDQRILFSENDNMTKIQTISTAKGNGLIMRSMFGLMEILTGSFQSQEENNIEALKTVIENNTTNYYAVPASEKVDVSPQQ